MHFSFDTYPYRLYPVVRGKLLIPVGSIDFVYIFTNYIDILPCGAIFPVIKIWDACLIGVHPR